MEIWTHGFKYLEISLNQHDNRILKYLFQMPVWIFTQKEDESSVSHLEIVEVKIMILRAFTLLVFFFSVSFFKFILFYF